MNDMPPELKSALGSKALRTALGSFLAARSEAVKNAMLRVTDHAQMVQLQGRALELEDLRILITQEK